MATKKSPRKNITKLIGLAAVLTVGAITYLVFDGGTIQEKSRLGTEDSQAAERGERVYAANCAACHGANLEGQPNWRTRNANGRLPAPPHDASGHTWHHDDQTLFKLTKYGLSALVGRPVETDMPAYEGKLTDDEIRAALAYIRSQWPKKIQDRQAALNAR